MKKLSTQVAWQLRERGIILPTTVMRDDAYIPSRDDVEYENERVREIAAEQRVLMDKMDKLDRELLKLSLIEKERQRRETSQTG